MHSVHQDALTLFLWIFWWVMLCVAHIILSNKLTPLFCCCHFFPEQGHRSDLLRDCPAPQVQDGLVNVNSTKVSSLLPTPAVSTKKSGDRVRDPLPCVVYGSSCHTADYLTEMKDSEDSVSCPKYICKSPPPPPPPPYGFHRHLRRAQTSAVNRIVSFEKWLSPHIRSNCPQQKSTLRLLYLMGGGKCHLPFNHLMEFCGAPSPLETFTLKTSWVVTWVFLFQELMELPPSFVCLIECHLKSSLMLDYQPYMMLYLMMQIWDEYPYLKVAVNVSSLITASMSNTRVLGHSHQESLTQFLTTLLLLLPSHNVNGNI